MNKTTDSLFLWGILGFIFAYMAKEQKSITSRNKEKRLKATRMMQYHKAKQEVLVAEENNAEFNAKFWGE